MNRPATFRRASNPMVVESALNTCQPDDDLSLRLEHLLPVLDAWPGTSWTTLTSARLIRNLHGGVPGEFLQSILKTLDPADSFWWPSGDHFFQLLRSNVSQLPAESTISFVRRAVDVARDQPSESSVRVVEVGSLLLADLHLLSAHHDAALDSAEHTRSVTVVCEAGVCRQR